MFQKWLYLLSHTYLFSYFFSLSNFSLWLAHSCAQVSVQCMVWLCLSVPRDGSLQYSALHTGLAYAWLTFKSKTYLTLRETLTHLVLYPHKPSNSTLGALTSMNARRKCFLLRQRKWMVERKWQGQVLGHIYFQLYDISPSHPKIRKPGITAMMLMLSALFSLRSFPKNQPDHGVC